MSFVIDHVKAVDGNLDRLQLSLFPGFDQHADRISANPALASRLSRLQGLIKLLSVAHSSQATLHQPKFLVKVLQDAHFSSEYSSLGHDGQSDTSDDAALSLERELEWFLLSKATVQVHGIVLSNFLQQTLPLNEEAWYWSDVLDSYRNTTIYSIQTSPWRLWQWSQSIFEEVKERRDFASNSWTQFYELARGVIRERSIADLRGRLTSPLVLMRAEIQQKQAHLTRIKLVNAAGIGYLMSHGFSDDSFEEGVANFGGESEVSKQRPGWKSVVLKNISIMDAVLSASVKKDLKDLKDDEFDSAISNARGEDPLEDYHQAFLDGSSSSNVLLSGMRPAEAAERLCNLLQQRIPSYISYSRIAWGECRRPSRLVRYWLPGVVLLLSSSTLLRIFVNRRAEIVDWIRDIGVTTRDFWFNWVLEPVRKVVGTIRHDESSEVSIMSKRSLEGDRASLERMVVDFAIDHPDGPRLSDSDVSDIRYKAHEGDLTPVLKVYERELSSPLYNSVMGSLIRALLIQVQKTKVDVEVAIGGIDALLKSQELVFGFVGLTPGILVCAGIFRWIASLSGSRNRVRKGETQSRAYQVLRNIDRILTRSPQSDAGTLSFREYGLLVVEATVLRELGQRALPKPNFHEFLQDFNDLIDNESGVGRQIRVADRIRWAYGQLL